jgi:LacI family transcriptional regulator
MNRAGKAAARGPAAARRNIAVVVETSNAYGRRLLAGIYDHVCDRDHWYTFLPEHGRGLPPLEELAAWGGDGIIARIETDEIARVVERLGLPTVDTSAARLLPRLPYVETDDSRIAGLAAEHFLAEGHAVFAFCGDSRFRWSENRRGHFKAELARLGRAVHEFDVAAAGHANAAQRQRQLGDWLAGLPRPAAVFAAYDVVGRQVIDACLRGDLAVPEQVAVLGVDDDELLCGLTTPPLSSVITDGRGAGRLAARLLDRLLAGEHVPTEHLLPPVGVAVRRSSDALAVHDPEIAAAVAFIRDNVQAGPKAEDVAAAVGLGRRSLESGFQRRLGRSIHDVIQRVQFQRVEHLLRTSDLKLAVIARRCGFKHAEYMTVVFTKRHGMSPSAWRQAYRPAASDQPLA